MIVRVEREQGNAAARGGEIATAEPVPPRAAAVGAADTKATAAAAGGRWKAVLVAAIAGVGLWLAVPRLIGSLLLLPGHQALQLLGDGKAITEDGEARARSSREAALPWHADRRIHTELATVKLYAALKPGQMPEAADQLVAEAKAHLRAGLALAPADPAAWLQWAYLRTVHLATGDEADTGLRMSVRTGQGERSLLVLRAAYAVLIWRDLSDQTRALMEAQFRTALDVDPRGFAQMVRALRVEDDMRALFAADPQDAERRLRRLDDALLTLFAGGL